MKKTMLKAIAAAALIAAYGTVANAATEITWWHAMGGELGQKLDEIVAKYNASQTRLSRHPDPTRATTPRR